MGDHTETVQVEFDPEIISYQSILLHFWQNHNPNRKKYRDREYISLILYHTRQQEYVAQQVKKQLEEAREESIQTEISSYQGFTSAVERQQKWHIKRVPQAMEQLTYIYPTEKQLVDATLVARLNSLAKGYGSMESVQKEIKEEKDTETRQTLQNIISRIL